MNDGPDVLDPRDLASGGGIDHGHLVEGHIGDIRTPGGRVGGDTHRMVELDLTMSPGVAARAFMLTMVAALVSALVVSTRPALVSSAIPTGIWLHRHLRRDGLY